MAVVALMDGWRRSRLAHGGSAAWRALLAVVLGFVLVASSDEAEAITNADYNRVGVTIPVGATLPAALPVTDEAGRRLALADLFTVPTVLVLADYTCRTLCGPVVDIVTRSLAESGLTPSSQFKLVVVGLDPRDTAQQAAAMRHDHISSTGPVAQATIFVTADQPALDALTTSLGYRAAYDQADDQFVHPAVAFVLAADRRVVRMLSDFGMTGRDMRLALIEAADGGSGTIRDRFILLCSSFDPVSGGYRVSIHRALQITSVLMVLIVSCGIALLALAGRRKSV